MPNNLGIVFANRIERNSSPTTLTSQSVQRPQRTHHAMTPMRPTRQKTITMALTGIGSQTSKNPPGLLKEKQVGYTNTDIDVKIERIQT
jgi:hypothetical protein